MMLKSQRGFRWLMAIGLLALAGCGPRIVELRGTLTQKGKPYMPPKKVSEIHILFFPVSAKQTRGYQAHFSGVGKFHVTRIPVGRYKVVIRLMNNKERDILKGAYEEEGTPFACDVDGVNEINIDLPEPLPG